MMKLKIVREDGSEKKKRWIFKNIGNMQFV